MSRGCRPAPAQRGRAIVALLATASLWALAFGCSVELGPLEAVGDGGGCSACSDGGDVELLESSDGWGSYDSGTADSVAADAPDTDDASDADCAPPASCIDKAKSCRKTCAASLDYCTFGICNGNVYCIFTCQDNYNSCVTQCRAACVSCSKDAGCASAAGCG